MKFRALQAKRRYILGKTIVGIDPAKKKHQGAIMDTDGLQIGTPFSFQHSYDGFTIQLWSKIKRHLPECNPETVVFAVETSCNLWQNLTHYLASKGYAVMLVSPVTTKRSRPFFNHDLSHTDPKDALLVASSARDGYFDFYQQHSSESNAMHHLSIAYCKLVQNYVQQRTRIRSFVELVFPEFPRILQLRTKSARYLLSKYFLPEHFLSLDVEKEAIELEKVSGKQHGKTTLLKLRRAARQSIGIPMHDEPEIQSLREILKTWLQLLETIEHQMESLMAQLITLAEETPYFDTLISLKGISAKLASLFIAETRELRLFRHYKQLEKLIGYNLRQVQSGQYVGARHISHIGNKRLSWIVYRMTTETAKYVPEVRTKYLRRQLKRPKYRKNIIASAPTLLKLIVSMVKQNRLYEYHLESLDEVKELETRYFELKAKKQSKQIITRQAA